MCPNIVFASGVLVPQRIAGLDYFKGLADHFPAATTLFRQYQFWVASNSGLRN